MKKIAQHTLTSPNKSISIYIRITDQLYYGVDFNDKQLLWYSPLSLELGDGTILGKQPIIKSAKEQNIKGSISTVWGIRKEIVEEYQELTLEMKGNYSVIFRAYNDGIAYRFRTNFKKKIKIVQEEVSYRFLKDARLLAHVVGDFQTSYERLYTKYNISEVVKEEFISLPLLVDTGDAKVLISESDLLDYPGMYIKRKSNNNRFDLDGLFPAYPTKWAPGGLCQFNLTVSERADYLAETKGKRDFPWRLMAIVAEDKELANNDLVYKLAKPSTMDTSWIKPGKVPWDWFNDWNLTGVDFETGVNNPTYEFYIDFAAENKLEYVIMDEGWSDVFDLLLPKPSVDVPHLVEYARKKGVGMVLWCVWHTIDRQMLSALDQFVEWGVVGIKVDFIDRDDQIAIQFQERLAIEAAKRKILVNYHGCCKPTGMHRTYPNIINYEGVRGNEYNKFDKDETPGHNVDLVYTRMVVGPMDYTPGSMRNSTKGHFFTDGSNPMSHGTRCHQLGMYVVYYSPMQMLCDAPTAYQKYPDILAFLADVPCDWDETVSLNGKISEYIVLARRKGKDWYVGALTNWTERTVFIDFSFLDNKTYIATLFLDGVNANRHAEDYQVKTQVINKKKQIQVVLKSGGGLAIQLKPK